MKLVKLSVAAALAAGLATSASAVELSEAIQDVNIKGYVRYRMNENSEGNRFHAYKVRVGANIPVNDAVSVNFTVGNVTQDLPNGAYAGAHGLAEWDIIHANFQYNGIENLTVLAGKQHIPTPFTDEEHGSGVVALYGAGPITLAAAAFDQHNATADDQVISALAVIGSAGMVNFSAWYANHNRVLDAVSVDVNAEVVENLTVGVRYSQLKPDASGADTNSLTKVYASMGMGDLNVRAAYAMTNKDGGLVAYDDDAAASFTLEQASLNGIADAQGILVGAGYAMGSIGLDLDYLHVDVDGDKGSELVAALTYNMSSNFYAKVLYSMLDDEDLGGVDNKLTRVEVKYSF